LVVGICSVLELIPNSAHEKQLRALQRGTRTVQNEVKDSAIEKTLSRISDDDHDVTVLGVSKSTNQGLGLPDDFVNQLVLVLGTTGAGKTITLRRFYQRAMTKQYPLIIVDGKPTDDNVAWIAQKASECGKPFYGFNCGNYSHYDPLAEGGYTELKDKIISLKDQWESDYYRSIAENYLQTTFEVMLATGEEMSLKRVVELLDYDSLALLVRQSENERLLTRVKRLVTIKKTLQAYRHI
jgi:DNA helicase HerA-like ATPase